MKHFTLSLAALLLLAAAIVVPHRAYAAGAGKALAGCHLMLARQATQDVLLPGVTAVGPHTQSTYGTAVSFLVHETDAPIIVRIARHRAASDEVGFVEFRDATAAKVTVNGVDHTADFDPFTPRRQVIVFPPHGGWLSQPLDLSVTLYDGNTNPDGSPHTIYDVSCEDLTITFP